MNERIKELESKAWVQVPRTNGLVRTEDFNQKFAELIVRECITVARGADGMDATHEAWYLIEQHFGIGMSTEDKKTLIKELLGVKND
jgi:hypothetical protein